MSRVRPRIIYDDPLRRTGQRRAENKKNQASLIVLDVDCCLAWLALFLPRAGFSFLVRALDTLATLCSQAVGAVSGAG